MRVNLQGGSLSAGLIRNNSGFFVNENSRGDDNTQCYSGGLGQLSALKLFEIAGRLPPPRSVSGKRPRADTAFEAQKTFSLECGDGIRYNNKC